MSSLGERLSYSFTLGRGGGLCGECTACTGWVIKYRVTNKITKITWVQVGVRLSYLAARLYNSPPARRRRKFFFVQERMVLSYERRGFGEGSSESTICSVNLKASPSQPCWHARHAQQVRRSGETDGLPRLSFTAWTAVRFSRDE